MSVICRHNAGFFSCCSVKLHQIVDYINLNNKLPNRVDSSKQFAKYKKHGNQGDITFDFFQPINNTNIDTKNRIDYRNPYQYIPYSKLDFKNISPLVDKYFSPSDKVLTLHDDLIQKYNINIDKLVSVYYRGTDKITETKIAPFEQVYLYIEKIKEMVGNNIQILIQTDSAKFIDYINNKNLLNVIIINENKTSYTNMGIHNENSSETNYNDMLNLFATFLVISKSKYIITTSGNCSIWMMFYRGHANNVFQYLNGEWYS